MSRKILIALVSLLAVLLLGCIGFIAWQEMGPNSQPQPTTAPTTAAPTTQVPTTEVPTTAAPTTEAPTTEAPTTAPVETTVPETTVPETTAPTEPEGPERFVLTFVGDCTLGSSVKQYGVKYSFIDTIGENYDYPFAGVADYFRKDDFTMANLEGTLSDEKLYSSEQFAFRGPTAYTKILTGSSVEAVTLANNHTMDFAEKGYDSTKTALEEAGVTYVERDGSAIYKTESGLTIGLYAAAFTIDSKDMAKEIAALRQAGAEIVVAAFHWGSEGVYRPNGGQQTQARQAIDAGADIVYGHHPHVLQPIESYKEGIIFYSLGNFSFGGNNWPQDLDTAILQQEILRDEDGKCTLGELIIIPASCSSLPVQNDFQPTPYEPGSEEFDRVLSKLDGSYKGGNLYVNYEPQGTETPETQAPTEAPAPETQAPTEVPAPETQAPTEAPAPETQAPTEAPVPETQAPAPTEAPATTPPVATAPPADFPDAADPEA